MSNSNSSEQTSTERRSFLKNMGLAVGAATAAIGAPGIASAKGDTRTLRIQSSWQPGTTGYRLFEGWCNRVVELTGGELAIKAFPAGAVSGDFQLFDAVRNGVLDGMNLFPSYFVGKMPAAVWMITYPMGLNQPSYWDILYKSYGVEDIVKEMYNQQGLEWIGLVHHDMNLIHSKKPIRSLDDFKGLKLRAPGGLVAECFAAIGAKTTLLPGSDVYPALEKGTIDAADYVGPAVNYDLGFHQVAKYIVMGPTSTPCLHQSVDLMDFSLSKRVYDSLSPHMQQLLPELVAAFSLEHYTGIQKANIAAWAKYAEAGVEVTRLSEEDVARFRKIVIPLWFKWANINKDSARLFKLHLECMQNPEIAMITPDDIKGYTLDL